ncbi:hypothetical protein ACQEVF_09745 [Nonomuraea polychroma]|uniref:hypothetical protein n=1 Tax=Nonomuraea polychroma TaxID=46176 RepID=UPI003D9094AC
MIDIVNQINATHREIGNQAVAAGAGRSLLLRRTYGPGTTIGIGGGWDLTLLGLDLFLRGVTFDPATYEDTPEVKEFATAGCHAWGPAVQAAWGTSDDDIAAAVAFAVQHFAPGPGRDGNG